LGSSFAWLGRGIIRRPAGLRTAPRAPGQQEPASSFSPDVPEAAVDLREELVHRQRLDEDAPVDRLLGDLLLPDVLLVGDVIPLFA